MSCSRAPGERGLSSDRTDDDRRSGASGGKAAASVRPDLRARPRSRRKGSAIGKTRTPTTPRTKPRRGGGCDEGLCGACGACWGSGGKSDSGGTAVSSSSLCLGAGDATGLVGALTLRAELMGDVASGSSGCAVGVTASPAAEALEASEDTPVAMHTPCGSFVCVRALRIACVALGGCHRGTSQHPKRAPERRLHSGVRRTYRLIADGRRQAARRAGGSAHCAGRLPSHAGPRAGLAVCGRGGRGAYAPCGAARLRPAACSAAELAGAAARWSASSGASAVCAYAAGCRCRATVRCACGCSRRSPPCR